MNASAQMLPDPLPDDPMPVAAAWLKEAWERRALPNPDAMVLATVDAQGRPSARVVLCKSIVADPGYLLFYTNYHSRKGHELEAHPRAAAVLHWDTLQRQLRIEGPVVKATSAESDAYFATRAWQRQLGAWASRQSEPVESRAVLVEAVRRASEKFGTPDALESHSATDHAAQLPRPPHWGGYRLWADAVELWVQGEHRIHDRARWERTLAPKDPHSFAATAWHATRLQP
ncbi:MAG TPA: pyridoxamine 5'-phosphate oxidase [Steroidobacteraceae bacterium]|jgi:pyridoxamine 5'-phosphate oxidase|nr:pyridoxamine 5'-phosphate oxidase [Steroidobacteraceae bacterium]